MTYERHILVQNIYYMLAYAFNSLKQDEYKNIATEEFNNLHNLFAALLAAGIGKQLKQGLYREYIDRTEDLSTLRGKLDMPGTMKNAHVKKRLLSCEFDELSENNLFNKILKTTVMLLVQHAEVKEAYKAILKKEMFYFAGVDTVDPSTVRWSSLQFQRNNRAYRILISLCQLVLEGMLLTTDSGELRLMSFVDEQRMCRLFEKFILEYYRREHPELKVAAAQIPWALDDCAASGSTDADSGSSAGALTRTAGIRTTGTLLPVMQTDITLSRGDQVLIIDAKYYARTTQQQYGIHTLHSHNLYQIFAYVKNRQALQPPAAPPVSGMLLYAKTDTSETLDGLWHMSGNPIGARTLDLNKDFSHIRNSLDAIAREFLW